MTAETKSSPAPDPEEPPKTRKIPQWVGAIAALALTVGIVGVILFYGYKTRPGWVGVADKKFWDYLALLIVPAALALGVYLLNRAQQEREREAEEAQQRRERKAEEDLREREHEAQAAQRERELEVENQRAQDAALQSYLDQMAQLLINYAIVDHPDGPLSVVARARTLTVLPRLDGRRKRSILQFLYESGVIDKDRTVVDLTGADLVEANLREADLSGANLGRVNLSNANLFKTNLAAADLRGANLVSANVSGANLGGADLSNANLAVARAWTEAQLTAARSLEGATMPNGQKYEDWLKSKGRRDDGENSGTS